MLDLVTTEASNRAGFMVEKFYYTPPRSQEKLALEVCVCLAGLRRGGVESPFTLCV